MSNIAVLFILSAFIKGIYSQTLELKPFPSVEVLKGDTIALTCTLIFDEQWESLIFISSLNPITTIGFFRRESMCENYSLQNSRYNIECNYTKKEFSVTISDITKDETISVELSYSVSRKIANSTSISIRAEDSVTGSPTISGQVGFESTTNGHITNESSRSQETLQLNCTSFPNYPINVSWNIINKYVQENAAADLFLDQATKLPANVTSTSTTLHYRGKRMNSDDIGYCLVFSYDKMKSSGRHIVIDVFPDQLTVTKIECPHECNSVSVCSMDRWKRHFILKGKLLEMSNMSTSVSETMTCIVKSDAENVVGINGFNSVRNKDLPLINTLVVTTTSNRDNKDVKNKLVILTCYTNSLSIMSWNSVRSGQVLQTKANASSIQFTISEATCKEIDNYRCTARTEPKLTERNISLLFECKPLILNYHTPQIQDSKNGDFNIELKYLGYPMPTINVFRLYEKNVTEREEVINATIQSTNGIVEHSSNVMIANASEFERYVIELANVAGKTEYTFKVVTAHQRNSSFKVTLFSIVSSSVGGILLVLGLVAVFLKLRPCGKENKSMEENETTYVNAGRVIELAAELPYQDLKPQEEVELTEESPYAEVKNSTPVYLELVDYLRSVHVPRRVNTEVVDTET